jgi:hypothetical protein
MATEFKARVWRRHFRGVINALLRSHRARVVGAAMLCLASAAVTAEASHAEGSWLTDPSSGCRVWNPDPGENETVSWTGACREGLAEGYGVIQWFQDDQQIERYEGDLRGGIQSGSGVLIRGGLRYDGQFRDGRAHGVGRSEVQGRSFLGIWDDGCFREGNVVIAVGKDLALCH